MKHECMQPKDAKRREWRNVPAHRAKRRERGRQRGGREREGEREGEGEGEKEKERRHAGERECALAKRRMFFLSFYVFPSPGACRMQTGPARSSVCST